MLNRIFRENCNRDGYRTALVFGNDRYTYSQLEEQVARCAAALRRSGAEPEKGVALVAKNSPESIFSYLASWRLGVPAFLIDSGSKMSEFRRIFSENQVAVVLCEPEQVSSMEQVREETGQRFYICSRGSNFESWMGAETEPFPSRVYED